MLNFKKGKSLLRISGGKYGGKILRVSTDQYNDRIDSDDESDNDSYDDEYIENDIGDMIDIEKFAISSRRNKKRLTIQNFRKFKNYVKKKQSGNDKYDKMKEELLNMNKKELKIHQGQIQPYFYREDQKFYVAGPSGAGKSFYCAMILRNYKRIYPNREIYIFSDVMTDPVLDRFKPERFDIYDPSLLTNPIKPGELSNCLVMFDDIDAIRDKKVSEEMIRLRDSILTRGRHEGVACICTNHILCNREKTRVMITESNQITIFPGSGSNIDYLLKTYCGMHKKEISKIKKLPSRWVTIHTEYPRIIFYRSGCYICNIDNEEKK